MSKTSIEIVNPVGVGASKQTGLARRKHDCSARIARRLARQQQAQCRQVSCNLSVTCSSGAHGDIELVALAQNEPDRGGLFARADRALRCRDQRLCRLRLVHVVECPRLRQTRKRGDSDRHGGHRRVFYPGSERVAKSRHGRFAFGEGAAPGGHRLLWTDCARWRSRRLTRLRRSCCAMVNLLPARRR